MSPQFRSRGHGANRTSYPVHQGQRRPRHHASRTLVYPSAGIKHEGELTKHGYNLEEGEEARESALNKAVREDGAGKTIQRLNALAILNKHHPEKHHKLEMDMDYVRMFAKKIEA